MISTRRMATDRVEFRVIEQLTLPFDLAGGLSRPDFSVGAANRAAVEMIERWPEWPSRTVVLIGPPASGKSHLAAILAERSGARVVALAGADLQGLAASALDRPLVLEDAGPGLDQAGLFHLLNSIEAAAGHLMITSTLPPSHWGLTLADLVSRLRAASPVGIDAPDDRLLRDVIAKLFADRQTVVDPQVISYMVDRMERSYQSARDLVAEIDRRALQRKSAITRPLVADVLATRPPVEPFLPGLDPSA